MHAFMGNDETPGRGLRLFPILFTLRLSPILSGGILIVSHPRLSPTPGLEYNGKPITKLGLED